MRVAEPVVDTKEAGWAAKLAEMYRTRTAFTFKDSAGLGIDLAGKSLWDVLLQSGLTMKEALAVMTALGVSGFGGWMIRMAIVDPEPASKAVLAVLGSGLMVFGFGAAFKVLTGEAPANVELAKTGVKVKWT
jgi:hypothetical protein